VEITGTRDSCRVAATSPVKHERGKIKPSTGVATQQGALQHAAVSAVAPETRCFYRVAVPPANGHGGGCYDHGRRES